VTRKTGVAVTRTTVTTVTGPEENRADFMIIVTTERTWNQRIATQDQACAAGLEIDTTSEQSSDIRMIIIIVTITIIISIPAVPGHGHRAGAPSPPSAVAPSLDATTRLRTSTRGIRTAYSHQSIMTNAIIIFGAAHARSLPRKTASAFGDAWQKRPSAQPRRWPFDCATPRGRGWAPGG